jgi:alanine racemase
MYMDMVRPGIALYGMYPGEQQGKLELQPAMELKTRIATITEHEAGDTISYGRAYTAEKKSRIAVLPIGYADGLHRALSNKMEVLIHERRARQVGRICMDMCMIDVTDIPGCAPGDVVTVFGRDGSAFLPVEEQAEKAGTINYEIVCDLSKRVPRVYL